VASRSTSSTKENKRKGPAHLLEKMASEAEVEMQDVKVAGEPAAAPAAASAAAPNPFAEEPAAKVAGSSFPASSTATLEDHGRRHSRRTSSICQRHEIVMSHSHSHNAAHNRRHSVAEMAMRIQAVSMSADVDGENGEDEEDEEESTVSFREAVMTMVINCIGAGIVVFPSMMGGNGALVAPILCILGAGCCLECGILIADACTAVEESRKIVIRSYEMLANEILGKHGKIALIITKNSAMLGFIIVFLQLVVDSIVSMFLDGSDKEAERSLATQVRFFAVFPIFVLLAMLRDMSQLARVADFAAVAVVIVVSGILTGSCWRYFLVPMCEEGQEPSADCLAYTLTPPLTDDQGFVDILFVCGKSMAFFLFVFAMLGTVPTLRSQLEVRSDMPRILKTSFAIILSVYLVVMAIGYLGFGQAAPENALTGLAGPDPAFPIIAKSGSCCMIVNILLGMPIFAICVISVAESAGTGPIFRPLSPPNIWMRALMMAVLALASHGVPFVVEMIGIVSSVFGVCNNIFFPIALFHGAKKFSPQAPRNPKKLALHSCILLMGLLVLVFGLSGSVSKMMNLLAAEKAEMEAARLGTTTTTITTTTTMTGLPATSPEDPDANSEGDKDQTGEDDDEEPGDTKDDADSKNTDKSQEHKDEGDAKTSQDSKDRDGEPGDKSKDDTDSKNTDKSQEDKNNEDAKAGQDSENHDGEQGGKTKDDTDSKKTDKSQEDKNNEDAKAGQDSENHDGEQGGKTKDDTDSKNVDKSQEVKDKGDAKTSQDPAGETNKGKADEENDDGKSQTHGQNEAKRTSEEDEEGLNEGPNPENTGEQESTNCGDDKEVDGVVVSQI